MSNIDTVLIMLELLWRQSCNENRFIYLFLAKKKNFIAPSYLPIFSHCMYSFKSMIRIISCFVFFSALPYFLFSFYFLFISSKWDINRRHSFTNRRMFSTANIANYNNFSKVMFGLQVAVRLNIPSYYSFACSLFLENLEKRSKSKVRNIKMRFHEKKITLFFRFLI